MVDPFVKVPVSDTPAGMVWRYPDCALRVFSDDWAIFSVMQQKMLQVTHFKAHYSQNTVSDGLSESPPVKARQFEESLLPWPVRTTKG
jgi:hypothetical protein